MIIPVYYHFRTLTAGLSRTYRYSVAYCGTCFENLRKFPAEVYPNIAAEWEASCRFNPVKLAALHTVANVTPALMDAIMDGSEEMTLGELNAIRSEFTRGYRDAGINFGYLLTRKPALMPTQPWRRKEYTARLKRLLLAAEEVWPSHFDQNYPKHAWCVHVSMALGSPVTYAEYQLAIAYAKMMIAYGKEWSRAKRPRDIGQEAIA